MGPEITVNATAREEWMDVNGHMNATHYGLVLYDGQAELTRRLGLGDDYVARTQCGNAVLNNLVTYEREVMTGDELQVKSWLLAVDWKRLHFFHELFNLTRDCRAAIEERVDVHMDLNRRCSTPFSDAVYRDLQARVRENLAQPQPAGVGHQMRPPVNTWLEA